MFSSDKKIEVILASRSKARRQILENCGFEVKVIPSSVEESKEIRRCFSYVVKNNALTK
jgi:predicted house-cleaning NTP pyrophosphatase (Maf/HAM1 superfamily)